MANPDFSELKDQLFAKKHNTTRENFNPKPSKAQQKKHLAALEESLAEDRLLKKLALIKKRNEGVQDLVDVKPSVVTQQILANKELSKEPSKASPTISLRIKELNEDLGSSAEDLQNDSPLTKLKPSKD